MIEYYTTGQFSKMAHVTERTIRYYDKIGLLKPTKIASNGYRKYTDKDFWKLQKILSLKQLGFSIDEIFPMVINDSEEDMKASFEVQIKLLGKRISQLTLLKDALKTTSATIDNKSFNWNNIIDLVKLTNMESDIIEHYKNTANLNIRISLHDKYSINKQGWFPWLFMHIDFTIVIRLLELGCGNGKLWENKKINLRNREIFLTDSSSGMVEEVRKKMGNEFNCLVAECEYIPFKDSYFDALIANHVLFYVKNIQRGLKEVHRVLKKGGTFYCSTYGSEHMHEITEIVQQFDSRIFLSETRLFDHFGLDSGKSILLNFFSEVKRFDYQDKLIIDEVQPLVDYILSCHGNQNEIIGTRINEFRIYIQNLLKERKKIEITKDAGLFICKK